MNQQLARSIIGCLHVSGFPESAGQELACFRPPEWLRILDWLDVSGLSLYFFDAMEKSDGGAKLPPFVKDRLNKNFLDNRQRVTRIADEFFGLNNLFRRYDIRYAALKGFSKVPDYCHDANLRTQFDHDFLVEPESSTTVDLALRSAGYIPKESHEAHPRAYILSGTPAWPREGRNNFYSSRLARAVEIHTQLWDSESEGVPFRLPKDFLQRAVDRSWGGQTYPALCEEDALLFEVLHALRHLFRSWCRLSVLYEMACFLDTRRSDADFWRRFEERILGVPYLSQAAGVVFALAERLLQCEIPISARSLAINVLTPPQRLWVDRYGEALAIDNFRKTKFSHFLQREFAASSPFREAPSRRRLLPTWKRVREVFASALQALLYSPHGLQQTFYTVGRVRHHITASLGYALEHSRWRRLRAKSMTEKEGNA